MPSPARVWLEAVKLCDSLGTGILDPGENSRVIWEQSGLPGVTPHFQRNFAAQVHSVLCVTSAAYLCGVGGRCMQSLQCLGSGNLVPEAL